MSSDFSLFWGMFFFFWFWNPNANRTATLTLRICSYGSCLFLETPFSQDKWNPHNWSACSTDLFFTTNLLHHEKDGDHWLLSRLLYVLSFVLKCRGSFNKNRTLIHSYSSFFLLIYKLIPQTFCSYLSDPCDFQPHCLPSPKPQIVT